MSKGKNNLSEYKNAFKSAYSEQVGTLLNAIDIVNRVKDSILSKLKIAGAGEKSPELTLLSMLEEVGSLEAASKKIGEYCRYMNTLNTDLLKGERDA